MIYQEMLFKLAGVPMVENCMGGYNSCMFAYGQVSTLTYLLIPLQLSLTVDFFSLLG